MVLKGCHIIDPCLTNFFLHFSSFSLSDSPNLKISLLHQALLYVGHHRRISKIMATNGSLWAPQNHHQWCLPAWPSPLSTSLCFPVLSSPAVAKLLLATSLAVLLSGITALVAVGSSLFPWFIFSSIFYFSLCLLLRHDWNPWFLFTYLFSFD